MSEGVLAEFFPLRSFYDYYPEVDWVTRIAFPVLACLENYKLMVLRLILNSLCHYRRARLLYIAMGNKRQENSRRW